MTEHLKSQESQESIDEQLLNKPFKLGHRISIYTEMPRNVNVNINAGTIVELSSPHSIGSRRYYTLSIFGGYIPNGPFEIHEAEAKLILANRDRKTEDENLILSSDQISELVDATLKGNKQESAQSHSPGHLPKKRGETRLN